MSLSYRVGTQLWTTLSGPVFEVEDTAGARSLLVLPDRQTGRTETREAWARLGARLRAREAERRVLGLRAVVRVEGRYGLISDGVDAAPLHLALRQGPLPPRAAVEVLLALTDCLAAGGEPLVHGRIGLDTVLATETGQVLLVDLHPNPDARPDDDVRALGLLGCALTTGRPAGPSQDGESAVRHLRRRFGAHHPLVPVLATLVLHAPHVPGARQALAAVRAALDGPDLCAWCTATIPPVRTLLRELRDPDHTLCGYPLELIELPPTPPEAPTASTLSESDAPPALAAPVALGAALGIAVGFLGLVLLALALT